MQLKKIKKIVIFGGGTSGWLTAAYMTKNLQIPCEITLIEDATAGPIGVGEGTQPYTAAFLYQCGIPPKAWMKPSNASFKYGVELVGWTDEPYFVDNDTNENCIIAEDFYTPDYFIDRPYKEFSNWQPAYQLAKKNVCQKFDDYLDVNLRMGAESFGAVHFSALDIIKTIKEVIINNIKYIDTKITNVIKSSEGIDFLVSETGEKFSGDLFIDCSGFESRLLEKELGVPFDDYSKWLLNDSAIVMQTQYTDPNKECFPYTRATAMNAGWRFTIPIFSRIGNGYIYSSKFISDEDAEKEFRESLNNFESPVKKLKMRIGEHKEIAHKNVCAVGLSAGFVEPLEATGITFTTSVVKMLTSTLNATGNVWGTVAKNSINESFHLMATEILTFVWAHYHFSTKNDTPYWQYIRSQKIEDLPPNSRFIIEHFLPVPKRFLLLTHVSMFNIVQWFSMLHAGGAFKNVKSRLTNKQKEYAEYYTKSIDARIAIAEKMFKNQYEYLSEWYSND